MYCGQSGYYLNKLRTFIREIPLWLLHCCLSPFLCVGHRIAVCQFSGIFFIAHIARISFHHFLSPYLISSTLMLFSPGDWLFFNVCLSSTLMFSPGDWLFFNVCLSSTLMLFSPGDWLFFNVCYYFPYLIFCCSSICSSSPWYITSSLISTLSLILRVS